MISGMKVSLKVKIAGKDWTEQTGILRNLRILAALADMIRTRLGLDNKPPIFLRRTECVCSRTFLFECDLPCPMSIRSYGARRSGPPDSCRSVVDSRDGVAACLAPVLERHRAVWRRWLVLTVPILLGIVLLQAGWIFGSDRLKQWREDRRPWPPNQSPNVLLVVLNTVRADHLSVYGYQRPTSPSLERRAARGVRFDQARAPVPWTLASHASMFTGRLCHEVATGWMHPLRGGVPTLAEYLGSLGYATAGFVGNTFYCSYDSGLDCGFAHYQDYVIDILTAVRTVHLIDLTLKTVAPLDSLLSIGGLSLRQFTQGDRKVAAEVNHEFLNWLSWLREPRRPFFAFLNYADAHAPYVLPAGEEYRFGSAPETEADFLFLLGAWSRVDKRRLSPPARMLARDSYDNRLA